jgi:phosphatidylglycerophosphatase C
MRTVAAFDFDKTLSTRDNVIPFMRRVGGPRRFAAAVVASAPALALHRRDAAKARAVRHIFAGRDAAEVRSEGKAFADEVVARHLNPDALARAAWHRSNDHELVIVSASFDVYLEPIAARLGFQTVLATGLEVASDGRLTGRLDGANVRGDEKVRRLDHWLRSEAAFVWAYGDSAGDEALLARADRGIRVHRGEWLPDSGA